VHWTRISVGVRMNSCRSVLVISTDIKLDKGTPAALRKSAGTITKNGWYCTSFQHIWDVLIPLISFEVTLKKKEKK